MKTKAAVAFEAGKPLEICEVDLEGPKSGEVLIELKATGICHTDALDSERISINLSASFALNYSVLTACLFLRPKVFESFVRDGNSSRSCGCLKQRKAPE